MDIVLKTLTLKNFKSHRDLTVNFGEVTKITGDNAEGKTTVVESIPWLLYFTDAFGSKLDPTPITYESDLTSVSLLFTFNGKQKLLSRELKKGKVQYYIDEIPKKAGEFNELVAEIFGDKDLFNSLFNPNYFFALHWETQRAMILKYVSAPLNKEVLKHMPDEQSSYLDKLLKKNSLKDIQDKHKQSKPDLEKKYIAAQSKTKTLKEQLEQLTEEKIDIDSIKAELAKIDKQVREMENAIDDSVEINKTYNAVQSKLLSIQDQIDMSKERWPSIKNEVIEDTCKTCKRPLDDEAVEAVTADKDKRIQDYKSKHNGLVAMRKELREQLESMKFIDVTEEYEKVRELDATGQPLREAIRTYSQYEGLYTQVKNAEADENSTHQALKAAVFTLDCVKAFKAKEAELQAEKVQALFDTLSIRLFKQNKGDGEHKPDFEIEMDGKPYRNLSLSEGIRAGLELREVLSKQSEMVAPVFVDNAESITSFKEPSGQLIISRVVAGQNLKIEGVDGE